MASAGPCSPTSASTDVAAAGTPSSGGAREERHAPSASSFRLALLGVAALALCAVVFAGVTRVRAARAAEGRRPLPAALAHAWPAETPIRTLVYVDQGCPHCHAFVDSLLRLEREGAEPLPPIVVISAPPAFEPTTPWPAGTTVRRLVDTTGAIRRALAVTGVPTVMLFAGDGRALATLRGARARVVLDTLARLQGGGS